MKAQEIRQVEKAIKGSVGSHRAKTLMKQLKSITTESVMLAGDLLLQCSPPTEFGIYIESNGREDTTKGNEVEEDLESDIAATERAIFEELDVQPEVEQEKALCKKQTFGETRRKKDDDSPRNNREEMTQFIQDLLFDIAMDSIIQKESQESPIELLRSDSDIPMLPAKAFFSKEKVEKTQPKSALTMLMNKVTI